MSLYVLILFIRRQQWIYAHLLMSATTMTQYSHCDYNVICTQWIVSSKYSVRQLHKYNIMYNKNSQKYHERALSSNHHSSYCVNLYNIKQMPYKNISIEMINVHSHSIMAWWLADKCQHQYAMYSNVGHVYKITTPTAAL